MKAQYVVVSSGLDYQGLKKRAGAGQTDRRKTGVNRADFGCSRRRKIKNTLDSK
jgi:hypothetical protein